jgi:hypothetical protein
MAIEGLAEIFLFGEFQFACPAEPGFHFEVFLLQTCLSPVLSPNLTAFES